MIEMGFSVDMSGLTTDQLQSQKWDEGEQRRT